MSDSPVCPAEGAAALPQGISARVRKPLMEANERRMMIGVTPLPGRWFMKSIPTSASLGLLLVSLHAAASAAAAHVSSAAALSSAPVPMHQYVQIPTPPHDDRWSKAPLSEEALKQIARLREEGLVLQKADGGKLTHEHRDYLQRKLDAIRQGR